MEDRLLLAVLSDPMLAGGVSDNQAKVFLRTDVSASVAVEFSTTQAFVSPTVTAAKSTTSASDLTAIVTLDGLSAETKYFYRAIIDGVPQTVGTVYSFTTFAAPDTVREFRFAVTTDVVNVRADPDIPAPAYASLAADGPAFLMQVGDFDHRNPKNLAAMRQMNRAVRSEGTASGSDFAQNIAPVMPLYHVWDDHDLGINDADKTWVGIPDAVQAFDEYYPTPDRPNANGIWHQFEYAQAEFFMLDVRSQRDPADDPNGPNKSVLNGDDIPNGQLEWLENGLLNSTATWKFLAGGVPFNPTAKPLDSWGAFPDARQKLLDFISTNNITGVVWITGDLHTSGALDDGSIAGLPEISVPHTNLPVVTPASGNPGQWSEGFIPGYDGGGYSLISIQAGQLVLENRAPDGTLRQSLTIPSPILPGDMDGDGLVNLGDVAPFVQALTDRTTYDAQGYGVNADVVGDVDVSGTFDLGDIGAFSGLFVGPASASAAVSFLDPSLSESAEDNRIEARAVDANFASFEEDRLLLTRLSEMRLNAETAELTSQILDSRQLSDIAELNWGDALLEMLDELLI